MNTNTTILENIINKKAETLDTLEKLINDKEHLLKSSNIDVIKLE